MLDTTINPQVAVKFNNVEFSYSADDNSPAVNGVSFEILKGEFVSVIGHNGSGKSTLARLCNGLLRADSGSIEVFSNTLDNDENIYAARRRVGIVFQNPDNQMVASIVEDDVAFGPENLGVEREEIGRRIGWALDAVGMSPYRNSTPTRLSGGQKQRIAIAGVLAIKPDVLILDESTAMLDPKGRREVMSVVQKLNKEEGITVILITHFMEEALLADRTIVMNRGEIVMQGSPEQVFESGEQLNTFNLTLPEISVIRDGLNALGMNLKATLNPDDLANDIAQNLGLQNKSANILKESVDNSGEWDIKIRDLYFTYSKKTPFATDALKGINLDICEGQFFGIIGHTGSGKSTLVQHFNGLVKLAQAEKGYKAKKLKKGETPPTIPQLTVGNYNLGNKKCDFLSLRADVGMVFQYPEYQLFAETVYLDVAFGLRNFNKGISPDEEERAVREALAAVGLNYNEIKDKSPFDLSGGQKRRVAIAGVIVTKPKILILDEPAAGLDPLGKREIMELLHALHGDWCKTVIIVSHDMDEIAQNCTRAAVLNGGKVELCDTPYNLFSQGEKLLSYGLDIPMIAKICNKLCEFGIDIKCDYTTESFICAIKTLYGGEVNA